MRRLARRCEKVGNGAVAGADLDDGAFADVAESGYDGMAGVVVHQKVLSEFGFLLHRCLILWRTVSSRDLQGFAASASGVALSID